MANGFVNTWENCRIVAFDSYLKKDGKYSYTMGILQGREFCGMVSCDESIGKGFDGKTMFDKLCRIKYRTVQFESGNKKEAWNVVVGIDFIKVADK